MKSLILALFALTAVACSSPATKPFEEEILELETRYKATPEDTALARQLAELLYESASQRKTDSISPYHLLKSAMLRRSLPGEELEAIVVFQKLSLNYPDHPTAAEALFQEAFTWDTFVGNEEEAKKSYKEFLEEYPTHPRSATAQELLILLETDMPVLDIINNWKASDSTRSPAS